MIPRTVPTWQGQAWQEQLINLVRDPAELCRLLQLDQGEFYRQHMAAMAEAGRAFELKVPRAFVERMRPGDLQDPLLLQVLPQAEELIELPGYVSDPLAEGDSHKAQGVIQKYHGRVLLVTTGACAIHCRYCFRRHFPYSDHRQSRKQWQQSLQTIADDPTINEVILSGGDPLSAPDSLLKWLVAEIEQIPQVQTLRIHSRLPVVIPDRIDAQCMEWLGRGRLNWVMVIHANHANEIDCHVATAMARLKNAGVTLLNQTVLLKGVNDSLEALEQLSRSLFDAGVLPYYLHLLDKVAGAWHFDLPEAEAIALHQALTGRLPGYLVPKLVKEVPGAAAKQGIP